VNVEELVIRSRDGDVAAFEQLVRRYQGMAFGYSRALCGDPHLAEDSTQQAFLVAFLNLANLRDPARFGGWLRGIVRFETLRLLRPSRPSPGSAASSTPRSIPRPVRPSRRKSASRLNGSNRRSPRCPTGSERLRRFTTSTTNRNGMSPAFST
jgi:RNA polymerase sigma-70 factor (ECF subfamily)